eukprot:CAMPEP_0197191736 /NCGR_PEP_ID=MMETSP1423-20130617/23931_1 /TAXON_ID=476441 /ORGANISM="Pseudo-nitzschia heimii, Strain UNC1101" /LENGTH=712 /DNA_ID=CAMNT_0042644465 /DNA_START=188 /DNA_END=2326 /DNA_ORIENTATION=+
MIAVEKTIRAVLLVGVACIWLSDGAFAHPWQSSASTTGATTFPGYRIRRRKGAAAIREERRDLVDFVPSFSNDDDPELEAKMPKLTLLLRGMDGETLGEKAYDALQTAMNDYLRKRFEEYFLPQYAFEDARSKVTGDIPFEGYSRAGGNAISLETVLTFRDPNASSPQEKSGQTENGPQKRQSVLREPTFRDSDLRFDNSPPPVIRMENINAVPSDLELEIAAGYAWNDLSSFRNHLLVAATIESLDTFRDLSSIDSLETFPTDEKVGEEIVVAEGAEDVTEEGNEDEEAVYFSDEAELEEPVRGDVVVAPNPGSTLNVAAASASLTQSGTDRLNPLWPALIVGIAVFLCTIIILGYRKQKVRSKDPFGGIGIERPDNVLVHIVNDNSALEGDEEIEVEDQLFSHPTPYESRKEWKKQERDLDKEYAASCLKPATMVLASSTPPSTSAVSEIEEDLEDENDDGAVRKKRNCLHSIGARRKAKRVNLYEQDSMAFDSNSSRGIYPPRRVDLTETRNTSPWSYTSRTGEEVKLYNHGDLSKKERNKFAKYIGAGLTLQEASEQVLSDRKANGKKLTPPSSVSRTRSGDFGGYSQRQSLTKARSNPMDCCPQNENLHSEVMADGTGVHYERNPSYMSLGAACSSNDPSVLQEILDTDRGANNKRSNNIGLNRSNGSGSANARAMVITAASSYASSYDDHDFDAALEEVAAETAMA